MVKKLLLTVSMLVTIAILNGCSLFEQEEMGELLKTYENKELLPRRILMDEDGNYTYWLSDYTSTYHKIAQGSSLDEVDVFYTADDDTRISEITQNTHYITWFETQSKDDEYTYKIKVYTKESESIEIIFDKTISDEDQFQLVSLEILDDTIFYLENDFENEIQKIIKYSMTSNKNEVFLELPFTRNTYSLDLPFTFINMKEDKLITSKVENNIVKLEVYDTQNKETVHSVTLPNYVGMVYNADFDFDTETFAAYYYKKSSNDYGTGDGVGVIKVTDTDFKEFFTPSQTTYLYYDKIAISGSLVYYTVQMDGSGDIIDHYKGVQYNLNNDEYNHIKYAIQLELYDNEFYALCFDQKEATNKINYYQVEHIK